MPKTKTIQEIEDKLSVLDPESLRSQVLEAVKKFKGNWLELGRYLAAVNRKQSYKGWGFSTFPSYCTRELKIREQTVAKLLRSFLFLKKEAPDFLSSALEEEGRVERLPDFEAVDILRKARGRKTIGEDDYARMKEAVFKADVEPRELGRQFRSMIEAARSASVDPDEAWEKRKSETVRRVLGSLKSIRSTLEDNKFLSHAIVETLNQVIKRIEDEVSSSAGE
jgi:hypothetical protein